MPSLKISAVYMRGGTSKGVFFRADALPADTAVRDRLLLRLTGSPDPYGKQIDGMGGATSSTSKVVIISPSTRSDCDVDYLFGAVAIDRAVIDWSGNCGNLVSAVGPFALDEGLMKPTVSDGLAVVRIWQVNTAKRIVAHVPVRQGAVVEEGDFVLDGVPFPAAEIKLEFIDPSGAGEDADAGLLPTGNLVDTLDVPGAGKIPSTLITAGNPTIFIRAADLGLRGDELQSEVNDNAGLLARCEAVRAQGAVAMRLASSPAEATSQRPATPKLAFVSPPRAYTAAGGRKVRPEDIDLTVRILSMGQLHHAMTGTGAIALAVAASIPGTIVAQNLGTARRPGEVRFGHPSGVMTGAAEAAWRDGRWQVAKATISRSARRLMEGFVRVPDDQSKSGAQPGPRSAG